ncbi:MAG TPA: MerR family transcriptional regulator, partial [Candidatus Pullichristensenella stercoripullorum]|nr:MerR family transcriptional regulator [Candidatus Pullichristensenella stercoripullorum]
MSVTTVKFYVKEGLIRPARKTGRNMAYYDRSCISAIALIRKLQRERYYPLSVIKRLMEAAPVERVELELLDAIHKVDLPDSEMPNPE